ncbi:MAG TPA: SAF domain-containing protein [Galbitalea sp.]
MATPRQTPESSGSQSRRRSFWIDPRFLIGIVLVVVSVLGVDALVTAANASVEVLAARSPLTPGERVHASDLVPTSVRVGRTAALYLRASDVPAAGVVVTRSVAPGELVPHSAIGSEAGRSLTSIVVSVNSALAASISPGSRVDLWASQPANAAGDGAGSETTAGGEAGTDGGAGAFAAPTVLVSSAIVVRLVDQKNLVASNGSSVELLMPKSATASVLDAIANGAVLDVLPVDLPAGQ